MGAALKNSKRIRYIKGISDTAHADAEPWFRSNASTFTD
jgi:hypothetical protein